MKTEFSYLKSGETVTSAIEHPPCPPGREEVVHRLAALGCAIVPDTENVPSWLAVAPREIQQQVVERHLELTNIYKISVPATASIGPYDLDRLRHLPEVQHLSLSFQAILPDDLRLLSPLTGVQILILRGWCITDSHVEKLPDFPMLRMLDLQDTSVTSAALVTLRKRFRGATVYVRGEKLSW